MERALDAHLFMLSTIAAFCFVASVYIALTY